MSNKILTGTIALLLIIAAALISIVVLHKSPSTDELDNDLATVSNQIKEARTESAKFEGGLVKGMIDARTEMLRLTESMLQAKRLSVLRRITLQYSVDSKPIPARDVEAISNDIKIAETRARETEDKASQYTGGLAVGLLLATAATQRMTVAQLQMAYYGAKYGVIAPPPPSLEKEPTEQPAGKIVKDRDAL